MTVAALASEGLTKQQIDQFHEEGFLIVRGAIKPQSLLPLQHSFERAVDKQANEWFEKGLIKDKCENLGFPNRYSALREQLPATHSNSWRRILVSRALYDIWQHPALLSMARSLLGGELYASATWNGRPRAPKQLLQTIDWHQDAHYCTDYDQADGPIVSMWFPLVPVDERSGCLQVAPRSHKKGYRPKATLTRNNLVGLADEELTGFEPYSCIMEPGDVLLFTELTYHRSLDNNADYTRWSLDIRYHDARSTEIIRKSTMPGGYYCYSESDPSKVESFETWAAKYNHYEGEF